MAIIARKITANAFILISARVAGIFISLATVGFITRYLGKEGYGEYSILMAFFYGFGVLANFGLYDILIREISRPEADEKRILGSIFTLRLLMAVLFFLAGAFLIFLFPYSDLVKKAGGLMAASYFLMSLTHVLLAVFQKHLKMIKFGLAEVLSRLFQLILLIILFKSGFRFYAVVLVFFLTSLLNFSLIFGFAKRLIKFNLDFNPVYFKKILKEALPLALSFVFIYIYFRADTLILSWFKPAEHVGIYSLPYRILEGIIFLPAAFVGLVMPHLSYNAFQNSERFKRIIQKSSDALNLISVPLIFGTIILAPQIIGLISGKQFFESILVLQILIVSIFFIFSATLLSSTLIALNRQKSLMKIYGLTALFGLIFNLILIPRYSYIGASVTTVLTELMVFGGMLLVIRNFQIKISFYSALKAVFASLAMALVVFYAGFGNIFINIILGAVSYAIFILIFKGIKKEDFELLKSK